MAVVAILVQSVASVVVANFTDRFRRHIKVTVICLAILSTACYVWLTLIVLQVLPTQLWQLYLSTTLGSTFLFATQPLFFEYTNELTFPVPEGTVGGFLTFGYNLVRFQKSFLFACLKRFNVFLMFS